MCGSHSVIARGDVLQAHRRGDVARAHFLDLGALARMHLQESPDALVAALVRHVHLVARVQSARVDTEKRQVADERIVQDLECECREGLCIVRLARQILAALAVPRDRRDIRGRWHVLDDRVEHRLHALVLECRAAGDQADLVLERARAQAPLDLLHRQIAALEVLVEQLVCALGGGLDHFRAPGLAFLQHVRRNVAVLELHALGLIIPEDGLHLDEIDHADEPVLGADGQLNGDGIAAQAGADLVDAAQEVRAGAIHLVDERDARHAVLVHLAPYRFRLRLYARYRAIDGNGRIEHTQAPLDLDGEVHVPRGIDDVDAMLGEALVHPLPEAGGRRGGDGDAALLLLLHVIHHGRAVVHLADLVRDAGVEKNALGRGGLARIDMRRDTDVAISLDGRRTCHGSSQALTRRI